MKLTSKQLRAIIREEVMTSMSSKDSQRFLHGYESGHPGDDEGYMLKRRMLSLTKMAQDVCNIVDEHDQFPAWVQDLVASAHNDMRHISDYLLGDEMLRTSARKESFAESKKTTKKRLIEAHSRITTEEMNAWMTGDLGFVSENDGGGPRRRSMDVIPADPDKLTAYIIRNYEGACADLGCEDVSDPVFKEYVTDQLAGKVDPMTLKMALAAL